MPQKKICFKYVYFYSTCENSFQDYLSNLAFYPGSVIFLLSLYIMQLNRNHISCSCSVKLFIIFPLGFMHIFKCCLTNLCKVWLLVRSPRFSIILITIFFLICQYSSHIRHSTSFPPQVKVLNSKLCITSWKSNLNFTF